MTAIPNAIALSSSIIVHIGKHGTEPEKDIYSAIPLQ